MVPDTRKAKGPLLAGPGVCVVLGKYDSVSHLHPELSAQTPEPAVGISAIALFSEGGGVAAHDGSLVWFFEI